jgi:hypothetical protein
MIQMITTTLNSLLTSDPQMDRAFSILSAKLFAIDSATMRMLLLHNWIPK